MITTKITTIILGALFTLSAFAQTPKFDASKLFVKLNDGESMPASNYIEKSKHLFGNVYLVTTANLNALEQELQNNDAVKFIERSYYAGKRRLPSEERMKGNEPVYFYKGFNDPQVGKVWSFQDARKNGVSVNKSYLAPLNIKKEEIIVAVVDTGVDYNHEDLKEVMWINENEIPGNNIDDDNNGYIDDVHGINPLVKDSEGNATGDPMASHAHGTHVAGTIGAKQNNGIGIAGIASTVKIMAIRTVPDSSDETDADVVESFLYAAKHGAKLINCSFGKNHNEGGMIVNETMDHIGKTYGTLVVAAAGNDYGRNIDNSRVYPASFESDYLMVIASTTKSGGLSWFSNVGAKSVDLAAPGSGVYSTVPGNRYSSMSGTSMATPTTVGVAAEVLSHFPNLGPIELKETLIKSVTKVKKFSGKMVSGGRVDLFKALQMALADSNSGQNQQQD
jgi:thermitase